MHNNSSKSRFVKITAKVFVMLLAVVLSLSVLPNLSVDIFPEASAAEAYAVPAGTSVATINSTLAGYSAGTVVDMTLNGDINFTDNSNRQFSNGITGIVIPEGITVNLFMNGKTIKFDRPLSDDKDVAGAWQLPYVYAIHNKGTLNIYAGATTTPNSTVSSSIYLNNARSGLTTSVVRECAYCSLEAVHNEGALTINKGVNISVNAQLEYDKINTGGSLTSKNGSQVATGATGVNNTSVSASCVLNDVKMNITAISRATYASGSSGGYTDSVAFAYGVYGGAVTVKDSSEINVTSNTYHARDTYGGSQSDGKAVLTSVAFGVASNGLVTMSGGSIVHDANITDDKAVEDEGSGKQFLYSAGIFTTSGVIPVMPDGTISTPTDACMNNSEGNITYRKGTVLTANGMIQSATAMVEYMKQFRDRHTQVPESVSEGTFIDEAHNSYKTECKYNINEIPAALNRGALAGSNRVHIVYRYWKDSNRSAIDTSVVSDEGYVGYSYCPLLDGTNVVKNLVELNGVKASTILTKTPDAKLTYKSGAESNNSYYWKLIGLNYATPTSEFSAYNVVSLANRGTTFKNFSSQSTTENAAPANNGPIYIFVDYARLDASSVKAKVGSSNVASTTYTGYPIKASDLGLQILESTREADLTSEYNIDFASDNLIDITYAYSGTNAAGIAESSEAGQLPTNAGTYQVTLKIAESITYDKNPNTNKNRYGLEYNFTLIIDQAEIQRGNLPTDITYQYGKKLSEVLLLDTYAGEGIANDKNVTGKFSFTNVSDGTSFKNAGENQVVSITWTPTYTSEILAKNYKATQFNVRFTVTQAPLEIIPNGASVIYGNENFEIPYSVTIRGLVGSDDTDAVKQTIGKALNYMILNSATGKYVPYVAGEIFADTYYIRATFTDVPAVLGNYAYTYVYGPEVNEEGVLTVNKRALSVVATATDRAYAPDNFNVNVTFEISEGKFGVDDVRFLTAQGGLTDNKAGTREVNGITKNAVSELITGGASSNYYLATVTYSTGDKLLVKINKAVPAVTTPVVEEMYYQRARTLKDVELTGTTSAVDGSWRWADKSINPTVNVGTYKAEFVPVDNENYDIKTVDVAIKVKVTPVVISYTGSVSYGDNVPNITAYTYKADLDPSFSIDGVTTSGNITPHTTYQKGSPVVAGGYPVEISAPNFVDVNGNYSFTTANGVITVTPRLITFTVQDATAVYGDNFVPNASTVKVTYDESLLVGTDTIEDITSNGAAPTFEYSTDFRYIDNYQVGSYYIKAAPNFTTSANYSVTSVQGTLKVTKAQLVIKADDITLEYGSAVPANISEAFTVVGAKRNETVDDVVSSGAIKVDTTYQKNSPVNTEGYPITVDVMGAVFNNYTVSVQHGTITVIKATPKVTALPTAAIVHGQTLGDAIFTGGAVENGVTGKYLYDSASTTPAYRAEAYTIYTVTFVPTDSNNYNAVTGLYVALTVNKKPVVGSLSVTGIPMVGEKLTVDVSGLDPDTLGVYTIVWYNEGGTQIGTGAEITLGDAHKLQALTVKAIANAPYTGEKTYVTTVIAPSLTKVETILTADKYDTYFDLSGLNAYLGDAEYTYNAQPHYVEFQRDNNSLASAAVGGVTVKYNGSTKAPTTVGYYTVTIDIATPDGIADMTIKTDANGNTYDEETGQYIYSPVANYKIGTLVITPAPYYVNVEVLDKVYDGTGTASAKVTEQYGACEKTGGIFDDVSFDEDAAIYYFASSEVGTDIDVFINNAQLKGEAAENYELLVSMSNDAKADITKRTLLIKVVPVARTYEENNYYVDLSFEPQANSMASGDEGFVYVDEASVIGAIDNYKAGIRNVTVSGVALTGSKANNYTLELTNLEGLTVEILKATPFYPIPMTAVLYYDSARPLNAISLGDSRWAWDANVANDVPGAGVHTYTAVYTPDDTANYAQVEYEVELEILKTVVTITAANFTVVYGDIEPTYYYSVTGLTGADTIKNSVDGYVLMNCSYAAGSNVGQYDIVLTGAFESDNYDFIYKNGKVTVNKRAAYVEAIAENREYEAGNLNVNVNFSAITNLYSADSGNDVFLEGQFPIQGTIDNENAGVKSVKFTMPALAGAKAENYELRLLNPSLTVEILKARYKSVVLPTSGTVGYGQRLSTTVFTSSFEGVEYGVFSMENPTSTPTQIGTFSDVYKVVFTPFNTQNYATIVEYITLTVIPSELNVVIDFTGTAQVGKSLYIVVNNIPSDATQYLWFEWYRMDSPDDDYRNGVRLASGTSSYTLSEGDVGKYILCTVSTTANAPYNCESFCVTDSPVEEENLTFWQKFVNWFYRIISNITQLFGGIM